MTSPTDWKKNRETWAKALESGEYKQGKVFLRNAKDEYCCLGVLADLAECEWEFVEGYWCADSPKSRNRANAPKKAMDWVGLIDRTGWYGAGISLARLNDGGKTFIEIAKIIREEPPGLFFSTPISNPERETS